jgi:hypothetical protein
LSGLSNHNWDRNRRGFASVAIGLAPTSVLHALSCFSFNRP